MLIVSKQNSNFLILKEYLQIGSWIFILFPAILSMLIIVKLYYTGFLTGLEVSVMICLIPFLVFSVLALLPMTLIEKSSIVYKFDRIYNALSVTEKWLFGRKKVEFVKLDEIEDIYLEQRTKHDSYSGRESILTNIIISLRSGRKFSLESKEKKIIFLLKEFLNLDNKRGYKFVYTDKD